MKGDFNELADLVEKLRGKDGCPWDREQTLKSIRHNIIEEAYETVEAINSDNYDLLREEAGDLLLQSVFISQLTKEKNKFDINDVIKVVIDKLVRRHPHVFNNVQADDTKEVLSNWEHIKKEEKNLEGYASILDDIPPILPALLKANKVQSKVERFGFRWDSIIYPVKKLKEEVNEFIVEVENEQVSPNRIEEEFGDILFTLVNIGRFFKINPEEALNKTIRKFITRFQRIEEKLKGEERNISDLDIDTLEKLWIEAKL
ncbi:MAG: nucleoside triphosphate pyrophosphohydrolase [Spirochaetes bacterium]|nr:nucleoside triphosphate pyrophosphohydrolase [Spirochaetota bacterium]